MNGHGLSDTVMKLFLDTPHVGPMEDASGEGWSGSTASGRYMRMQVRIENDHVIDARFGTSPCAASIACGAWTAEWAVGRTSDEISQLTQSDILTALGGLPVTRRYCARLAVESLHAAIQDVRYKTTQRT